VTVILAPVPLSLPQVVAQLVAAMAAVVAAMVEVASLVAGENKSDAFRVYKLLIGYTNF